jgi:chemotaxis protein methyltransferase CheR
VNERPALSAGRPVSIKDDLTDTSFECIARIAHEQAGLVLPHAKKNMVKSRVIRRLRALKISSFEAYTDLVRSPEGAGELRNLINALTTNVSQFFRENHHFDLLRQTVLPPLLQKAARGGKVRIWSAGCSNGQEPYTIAMVLNELDPNLASHDIRILATDIDAEVLAFARKGAYPLAMMEGVPPALAAKYFGPVAGDSDQRQVTEALSRLVTFRELNLHERWPMQGAFDLIFCRNVLIYFDPAMQERLLSRFREILLPDGWLMLGHSERIPASIAADFVSGGITALRKADAGQKQQSAYGGKNVA